MIRTIARMPDHDAQHHAIGLEIASGRISLLCKSADTDQSTRVELVAIKAVGPDVTIYLIRQFLTKAMRLGLTRIEITDPLTPLRFSNGGRQMIVMPAPASSIQPPRTRSEPGASITTPSRHAEQPEKRPMPEISNTNGATRSTTTVTAIETTERPALETALAQTITSPGPK